MVELNWIKLESNVDLNRLMDRFGRFHDSCLRELYLSTTAHVSSDLSMSFNAKSSATLLFQRQFRPDSVLELRFDDLIGLNYQPLSSGYNEVIYDATLVLEGGITYWADHQEWEVKDIRNGESDSVWIGATEVYYRFRPELIGDIIRLTE